MNDADERAVAEEQSRRQRNLVYLALAQAAGLVIAVGVVVTAIAATVVTIVVRCAV